MKLSEMVAPPEMRIHRIRERVPLGEACRCPICDRLLGRRALPWIASWTTRLPPDLSAALVAANGHELLQELLDFGSTVPGCEDVRQGMVNSGRAALLRATGKDVPFESSGDVDVMVGRHAGYHCDPGFGKPITLFLVLSTSFEGDLVFPNAGIRVPFGPGSAVLFDPIQPHGLCEPGVPYAGGVPACCLSVDLSFDLSQAAVLGVSGALEGVVNAAGIRVQWEHGSVTELFPLQAAINLAGGCEACTFSAGPPPT